VPWDEGKAVVALDLNPGTSQSGGVIHGSVMTSLLDIVLAEAGTFCP
jgi:acyl-coenzyme A thioesterase PaaI-like protein